MANVTNLSISSSADITQNERLRFVQYAKEMYSLSQQRSSSIRPYSVLKMVDGEYERFSRRKKRSWERKTTSITPTPNLEVEFDNRCLFINEFHTAAIVDPTDQAKSTHDALTHAEAEDMNALGRLQDHVALQGLLGPVVVDKASSQKEILNDGSAVTNNSLLTVAASIETRYQDNLYYDDGLSGDDALASSATRDLVKAQATLERVIYAFNKRAVVGDIVCTLTPELARILRSDPDFNDAEKIMKPDVMSGSPIAKGFRYRGINFIDIKDNDDIFPGIGEIWCGGKGSDSAGAKTTAGKKVLATRVFARGLSEAASAGPKESTTSAVVGLTNAGARSKSADRPVGGGSSKSADHKVIEVAETGDIAVFWEPAALYFGERGGDTFAERDKRRDLSYAEQHYMRVAFGALLIEAECALGLVVRGKDDT